MKADKFWLLLASLVVFFTGIMTALLVYFISTHSLSINLPEAGMHTPDDEAVWTMPDTNSLGNSEQDLLIKYGRELIARTSYYLGPKGKVMQITNGMNCQNCHLNAGTKIWGNNYSAVAPIYPKFRERSGTVEDIHKRVNDCIERSLNGHPLDTSGREMQAIKAYIYWLGRDVKKGVKPNGSGITALPFMERAANPENGKKVYGEQCQRCHGEDGSGKLLPDGLMYEYPPLWGKNSYNTGAGLYRLSRFAGYVKSNMPFGINYDSTQLTDNEAWDVAAFVNSQPRPVKDLSKDWPRITGKPVDHPFGPYADTFSEQQHKYGPFGPISLFKKKHDEETRAKGN